jgi:hypothetical protein
LITLTLASKELSTKMGLPACAAEAANNSAPAIASIEREIENTTGCTFLKTALSVTINPKHPALIRPWNL